MVLPEARRRGLARRLLAAAEEHARRRGAARCRLDVLVGNSAARQLYLSAGYEEEAVGGLGFLAGQLGMGKVEMVKDLV
ncbi:unnamed protein product [Phaeothamnion confervicola]